MGKHFSFPSLFLLEKMKENKKIKRKDEGMKLGGGEWTNEDGGGGGRIFPRGAFHGHGDLRIEKVRRTDVCGKLDNYAGANSLTNSWHDSIGPRFFGGMVKIGTGSSKLNVLCLFDDFWNFLYVQLNCGLLLNFDCVVRFLCEIL